MSSNPALYRYIDFIGGNILDASNVSLLQTELARIGGQGLGQLYTNGALLNAVFNITGTTIVFTAANGSFHVFGFVNGQFEDFGATVSIAGTQPTTGASNNLYLNWSLDIKTSVDDGTFIDGITGEPTIEVGQLSLQVSWTDTSGVSLNPTTQFAKNTVPIVLAVFNMSVPATVTVTYINGVNPYADANPHQAGFVRLTDNSGLAPGNTDSRLSDARDPLPASVFDVSVAPLIQTGTNSTSLPAWSGTTAFTVGTQIVDSNGNIETVVATLGTGTSGASAPTWNPSLGGQTVDNAGANQVTWVNGGIAATPKFDPTTSNQGGIFTDHIIYTTLKEKLTTFLDTVNTSIENTLLALANHIGKPLGTPNTHPFPTAFQVGAAPASHVGQALGLGTSHPALVNSDTSGFVVDEVTGSVSGDAYQLNSSTSTRKAAITHSGDLFSLLSNAFNAQGGNGSGGTAVNTGTLGLMSLVGAVLAEHVNYKTHGNNNPHNLDAADIGAITSSQVDTFLQEVIAADTAYADAVSNISIRGVTHTTTSHTIANDGSSTKNIYYNADGVAVTLNTSFTAATYVKSIILTFGGKFELAIGVGEVFNGDQVPLPEVTGWTYTNMIAQGSMRWITPHYDGDTFGNLVSVINPATFIARGINHSGSHTENPGFVNVVSINYRTITPAAIIISALNNTQGGFASGSVGNTITITGRNFGPSQGSSTLTFNGVTATASTWNSTTIVCVVPSATTGQIAVTITPAAPVLSPFVFTIS